MERINFAFVHTEYQNLILIKSMVSVGKNHIKSRKKNSKLNERYLILTNVIACYLLPIKTQNVDKAKRKTQQFSKKRCQPKI